MKSRLMLLRAILGTLLVATATIADADSTSTARTPVETQFIASMPADGSIRSKAKALEELRIGIETLEAEWSANVTRENTTRGLSLDDRLTRNELRSRRQQAAKLEAELRAVLFPDNATALLELQQKLAATPDGEDRLALIVHYEAVRASLAKDEAETLQAVVGQ